MLTPFIHSVLVRRGRYFPSVKLSHGRGLSLGIVFLVPGMATPRAGQERALLFHFVHTSGIVERPHLTLINSEFDYLFPR